MWTKRRAWGGAQRERGRKTEAPFTRGASALCPHRLTTTDSSATCRARPATQAAVHLLRNIDGAQCAGSMTSQVHVDESKCGRLSAIRIPAMRLLACTYAETGTGNSYVVQRISVLHACLLLCAREGERHDVRRRRPISRRTKCEGSSRLPAPATAYATTTHVDAV